MRGLSQPSTGLETDLLGEGPITTTTIYRMRLVSMVKVKNRKLFEMFNVRQEVFWFKVYIGQLFKEDLYVLAGFLRN